MLVNASGISRASIDRYFSSKADCVFQTAEWIITNINARLNYINEIISLGEHLGIELLRKYMQALRDIYIDTPNLFILIAEIKVYIYRNHPDGFSAFARLWDKLGDDKILGNIFFLGISDGTMRSDFYVTEEVLYTSEFLRELLMNLALTSDPTSEDKIQQINRFIEKVVKIYQAY